MLVLLGMGWQGACRLQAHDGEAGECLLYKRRSFPPSKPTYRGTACGEK